MELRYHYAITTYCDVLTLLLNTLLEYPIQHTTYLWSCGLLSRLLRSVLPRRFPNSPTDHSNCNTALDCNISDYTTTLSHTN